MLYKLKYQRVKIIQQTLIRVIPPSRHCVRRVTGGYSQPSASALPALPADYPKINYPKSKAK